MAVPAEMNRDAECLPWQAATWKWPGSAQVIAGAKPAGVPQPVPQPGSQDDWPASNAKAPIWVPPGRQMTYTSGISPDCCGYGLWIGWHPSTVGKRLLTKLAGHNGNRVAMTGQTQIRCYHVDQPHPNSASAQDPILSIGRAPSVEDNTS
jgi:hypothetical protein